MLCCLNERTHRRLKICPISDHSDGLEMSEDLITTLGVVRAKTTDLSARLNLTMRATEKQTPARGVSNSTR